MRNIAMAAGLLLLFGTQGAAASTLMSCDVIETRTSGNNTEIVYNESSCRPAQSSQALGTQGSGESAQTVYGAATQPVAGGGPVYIMRFVDQNQGPVIHYGAPLDGRLGTSGR
ncbi:hypothetical protein [Falsiroseomonas sp. E2-1-a20]|uniref:hypothetical protein n=1 Tax=Falsiroseomonas sp. E2-1-a20 TaxID=3239300 RepID=UPI003F2BCC09